MYICDLCHETVPDGGWPFCRGGHGRPLLVVQSDSIPGGLTLHNLGPTPVTVYSHSERRAIMKARGLVERVEHVDGDKHVGRMV